MPWGTAGSSSAGHERAMRAEPGPSRQERGAALLLAVLVLMLAGLSMFVRQLSAVDAHQAAERASHAALAQAKSALIGRAATDNSKPGSLPCPAEDEAGEVPLLHGNHCPTYLGRFPWKTLKTGPLRDGYGELLWYALAPALTDNQSSVPINSQTATELFLDEQSNIAAIIFAPGPPLPTQTARPGSNIAGYLDGANADGNYAFVSSQPAPAFNDRALPTSRDELFRVVGKRVLAEIRGPATSAYGLRRSYRDVGAFPWADASIDGYADHGTASGRLPYKEMQLYPAPPPASGDWLAKNGWLALIGYQRLGADAARLTLDALQLDVAPCPAAPCP